MSLRRVRFINFKSNRPSTTSSFRAITTLPPVIKGRKSSKAAMSNETVVTARSTSCSLNPGSFCIERRKFTTDRCSIITPFGLPVEPEV